MKSEFWTWLNYLQARYDDKLDSSLIAAIVHDARNFSKAVEILDSVAADTDVLHASVPPVEEPQGALDALGFLRQCFPERKDTVLNFALQRCDGDVERATEYVLSTEYINGELGVENAMDGFFNSPPYRSVKSGSSRRQRQHQQKNMELGWDQIQYDINTISSLMNIPNHTVQSTYHQYSADLPKTVLALLESVLLTSNSYEMDTVDAGDFSQDIVLRALTATQGNGDKAQQILNILKSGPIVPAPDSLLAFKYTSEHRTEQLHKSHATNVTMPDPGTSNEYKVMAADYRERRNRAFSKAVQAYKHSKSNRLYGGTAMYYAELV